MVYFTVASEGSVAGAIKRAYIPSVDDGSNNMGASVTLDINYITSPDGIAVDWVGRCVRSSPVSPIYVPSAFWHLPSFISFIKRDFFFDNFITFHCRNLYWADSKLRRLEVALLDGRYRKHLVKTDLGHPSAVALNPRLG